MTGVEAHLKQIKKSSKILHTFITVFTLLVTSYLTPTLPKC